MTAPGPWRSFTVSVESARLHWNAALVAPQFGSRAVLPRPAVAHASDARDRRPRVGLRRGPHRLRAAGLDAAARAARGRGVRRDRAAPAPANVRYVFSFAALPAELALPLGEASLPEVAEPLRLYELRGALPRAFFVPERPASGRGSGAEIRLDEAQLRGHQRRRRPRRVSSPRPPQCRAASAERAGLDRGSRRLRSALASRGRRTRARPGAAGQPALPGRFDARRSPGRFGSASANRTWRSPSSSRCWPSPRWRLGASGQNRPLTPPEAAR